MLSDNKYINVGGRSTQSGPLHGPALAHFQIAKNAPHTIRGADRWRHFTLSEAQRFRLSLGAQATLVPAHPPMATRIPVTLQGQW